MNVSTKVIFTLLYFIILFNIWITDPRAFTLCFFFASFFKSGRTPLHDAVGEGNQEIVQILLEKGAKADVSTKVHKIFLSFFFFEILFFVFILINGNYFKDGTTPLCIAVCKKDYMIAQWLLKRGANGTIVNQVSSFSHLLFLPFLINNSLKSYVSGFQMDVAIKRFC